MSDPSKKKCVETLMRFVGEETRTLGNGTDTSRSNVLYLMYECPRLSLCKNQNAIVSFQKGRGFTNPFNHLVSCYKQREEVFNEVRRHEAAMNEQEGGLSSQDVYEETSTNREKALFAYIKLIVLCNAPVSCVENDIYRSFSKYDEVFSRKYVTEILYALVQLVEKEISEEMKKTKGSIMHDCWTSSGVHYVGLFAVYITLNQKESKVVSPLLSMSPMARVCDCEMSNTCSCTSETTDFDSNTIANHIGKIFEYYSVTVSNWVLCQTADNCNLNRAVARILNIPHIGCANHKLNLQVESMIRLDLSLKTTIESVHDTMSDCRLKLRNRAMLRNLTSLSPVLENKTRWSGKYLMLSRFCRIYDQLRNVAENERSNVAMNLTTDFKTNATKFSSMLAQIDQVTKYLQTENLSLSDCRLALDTISESVHREKTDPTSSLYQCNLSNECISCNSHLVSHKAFESGVVKIQRCQLRLMSGSEKFACRSLLISKNASVLVPESTSEDERHETIMEQIVKKRQKICEGTVKYMDCRFICGSVAKVERLWSLANHLLQSHRKASTPMLAEAILFLKVNKSYWDLPTVCQAILIRRNSESQQI